ncbi:MAG: AraC family transcriptional activator of pobA [Saprospiraceae bacterium]|jgi:AraC-like DNA-binding protein
MGKIKSYKDVVPQSREVSFDIKRMEDIYELTKGKVDDPHRHDYYTVVLIKDAQGEHIIDFHTFGLKSHQAYFIHPGQVHQIIEHKKSFGFAMTFSSDFLMQNGIEKRFIQDLHIFQFNGHSPPLDLDDKTFLTLCSYSESMEAENNEKSKYSYLAIGAWLKLFLIECQAHCSKSPLEDTQSEHTSTLLLHQFQDLLEENYKSWHKVNQYAERMFITADHLNATINHQTGQNVKAHIQNRIILAAKRLLLFSDKTAKEIGYDLGFHEPSHFSQFFKKGTGQPPSTFIKNA